MRLRVVALTAATALTVTGTATPAHAQQQALAGCYIAENTIVQIGNQFAAHVLVNCPGGGAGVGTIALVPQLGLGVEGVGYGVILGSGYVSTLTYAQGTLTRCFTDYADITLSTGQVLSSSKTQCF